jgi:hypothetical protein
MDLWFLYTAVYLKSLGYVLPNCYFPEKTLQKVQKVALIIAILNAPLSLLSYGMVDAALPPYILSRGSPGSDLPQTLVHEPGCWKSGPNFGLMDPITLGHKLLLLSKYSTIAATYAGPLA